MRYLRDAKRAIFGGNKERAMSVPLEHDGESGWQGSESFKYKEWYNPEGTRRIIVTICGGPEYGGTWMIDIHLMAVGEVKGGEMMRVQAVTEPNSEKTEYNVYLDAVNDNQGGWVTNHEVYFWHDGGKKHECFSWGGTPMQRGSEYEHLTTEQYNELCKEEARKEGIYHVSELPPEIDIEETFALFMDQIQRQDFSKPVLVPKQPSLEGQNANTLLT